MFCSLKEAEPDKVFGVLYAYNDDKHPNKVNLSVGAYQCENGKPYVFPVVREVERKLVEKQLSKEYLPIDGFNSLKVPTQKLIFGNDCPAIAKNSIATVQTISGTGALRTAVDFIVKLIPEVHNVMLSRPTWANHRNIFSTASLKIGEYRYWDSIIKGVNLTHMLEDLNNSDEMSLVVLHASGHNPTGSDLDYEEWMQVLDVVQRKKLIPIFDVAYQGFATGDFDRDGIAIRLFQRAGLEMFVCQSFAKNMGLYGERVGMLHVVCNSAESSKIVLSHLKIVIRSEYSSPPRWGSQILNEILNSPQYIEQWKDQLKGVVERIRNMRILLLDGLIKKGTPGDWTHITKQTGMFSYTGLTPDQCKRMRDKWHIYLLDTGRISLAGLNRSNLSYVIDAIDDCVRHVE